MAYRPINIDPLDLKPSVALGVSIPFSDPSAFGSVYTTAEQLKYNIINYLLTDKGERVFNIRFGAGLRSQLFEQMTLDKLDALEVTLGEEIADYFPKVLLTELKIIPNYDQNYITLRIRYNIENTGKSDEILLNFDSNNL